MQGAFGQTKLRLKAVELSTPSLLILIVGSPLRSEYFTSLE